MVGVVPVVATAHSTYEAASSIVIVVIEFIIIACDIVCSTDSLHDQTIRGNDKKNALPWY
jgi:hypothetical protein